MRVLLWIIASGLMIAGAACCCRQAAKPEQMAQKSRADPELSLQKFIAAHVGKLSPLARENNLAQWQAATTGKKEAYAKVSRLEMAIRKIYADPDAYAYLKKTRAAGLIQDPLLRR